MNVLEYIENCGSVRTSSGEPVEVYLSDNEEYPIHGYVLKVLPNGVQIKTDCKWDSNGIPINPAENHGLELNPLIKQTIRHIVHRNRLSEYDNIFDFEREELKRLNKV